MYIKRRAGLFESKAMFGTGDYQEQFWCTCPYLVVKGANEFLLLPDPSQEAINAAREFLNAWRAYLNSLVASIRYHSITDVNEGGEGKVTILLKDSFLATFQGQDRSFMRAFAETQMFSTYCDEVLARD